MTPAQAKRERADLFRSIRIEEKKKDRARLVALRGRARALRAARVRAISEARRACRARRKGVPTLREAAAMLRAARAEARATCDAGLAKAKTLRSEAARARAERDAEATHQKTMRRLERHAKERASGGGPRLAKARVRQSESDDEVRANIPPELAFLFERVKRQIKGSPRRTRTEEFLEYAESHPDEELAALEDKTDALIAELEARQRRANGRRRNAKGKASTGAQRDLFIPAGGQLEIVPSQEQRELVRRKKESAEARTVPMFKNPRRPPAAWWDGCIARVEAAAKATGTRVREPRAVCGAAWWKLSPQKRGAIVRKLEGSKHARVRAAAAALARAERRHNAGKPCKPERRSNPREVVSLVYLEQKPGDREPFEYEHEFEGDRPRLEMRGGRAQLRGGSYRTRNGWLEG